MKHDLMEEVNIFLLKKGFTIRNLTRTCFDILARQGEKILLIKVLEDANAISKEYSDEMIKIAAYIQATPIIIAEKAGLKLQDNIIYLRFDVFTFNYQTFINCFQNKFPILKSTQAGLTASIDGKKLKNAREQLGFSLNSLSKKIGVTTKMVVKYENENSEITLTKASKLYDIFGGDVFHRINIFKQKAGISRDGSSDVSQKYVKLGFKATDTTKAPFDIIAKKENDLILTKVGDKVDPNVNSVSRLLDADKLVIFKKKKPKDIPAVTKKEFLEFEKARELIKFLKEF